MAEAAVESSASGSSLSDAEAVEAVEAAEAVEAVEAVEAQAKDDDAAAAPSRWARVQAFLLKWHLPLLLLLVILLGYAWPEPGTRANDVDLGGICFPNDVCVYDSLGSLCVTFIFVISGLKLKTDAIKQAASAWQASLYGVVAILFITPCAAFAVVQIDYAGVKEFAVGLALFFSVPTTLSSGPILVGQALGNVALALMLTVVTNIVGVFTAPLFVTWSLDIFVADQGSDSETGEDVDIDLDPVPLILKLVFTIIVPISVGKALRHFEAVRAFAKTYSVKLKLLSSALLVLIPWMKVSASADSFKEVSAAAFFIMWSVGTCWHLVFLIMNYSATQYALRLALHEQIAVVIVASQKTLPVSITILEFLPEDVIGSPGLVAIPIIVSHLSQILIDSYVAARFAVKVANLEKAKLREIEATSTVSDDASGADSAAADDIDSAAADDVDVAVQAEEHNNAQGQGLSQSLAST